MVLLKSDLQDLEIVGPVKKMTVECISKKPKTGWPILMETDILNSSYKYSNVFFFNRRGNIYIASYLDSGKMIEEYVYYLNDEFIANGYSLIDGKKAKQYSYVYSNNFSNKFEFVFIRNDPKFVFVYSYDSNGRLLEQADFQNQKYFPLTRCTYTGNDLKLFQHFETGIKTAGVISHWKDYMRDFSNRLTNEITWKLSSGITNINVNKEYLYGLAGDLKAVKTYFDQTNLVSTEEFKYSNRFLLRKDVVKIKESQKSKYFYDYDSSGNLINTKEYFSKDGVEILVHAENISYEFE